MADQQQDQDENEDAVSEDDAFEMALDDHPELKRMFLDEKLPDEMQDADGNVWSPMAHLAVHAAIEFQIANDEPEGIAGAAETLEKAGVDHHEIRHLLGEAYAEEAWLIEDEDDIDDERYMTNVRKIVSDLTNP